MAFVAGNVAHFEIQDSGGTSRSLSAFCRSLQVNLPVDSEDTTTFGKTAHTKAPTLTDSSFSISGFYDSTATTGPDVVLFGIRGMVRNFIAGPEGSTTGKVKYSGACVLTDYQISPAVDNIVPFSATFAGSDTITRGTFA